MNMPCMCTLMNVVCRSEEEDGDGPGPSSSQVCSQQFRESSQVGGHIAGQVAELLLHTYRAIGDPDAVYSCGSGTQPNAR